jgi:aminopeptidase YwaD
MADGTCSMRENTDLLAKVSADRQLWRDFVDICDCGGRLAGTESEQRAFMLIERQGEAATNVKARSIRVRYGGWSARKASLQLPDGATVACRALVRSIATLPGGLTAEVIDLGRGTPEEFEAHAHDIKGRMVLVRHELMFVAGTIHRRRKYLAALEAGAVGFLIAGPLPGQPVAGSSGRQDGSGIPAAGITPEAAANLRRTTRGWPIATLTIETEERSAETRTVLFDVPGQTDEWIVLSAHIDGHDGGESAMDNASGVAAALAAARALAPQVRGFRRGVRLALFSVEEWALTGSAQYVDQLSAAERHCIALNVNLDSVGGSSNLAALTSGFAGVEPFLLRISEATGIALRTVRPLMQNSDHANFALAGIPAIRLVAGFDDPSANLRYVLTQGDTRDKVSADELTQSAILTAAIVASACNADAQEVAEWRRIHHLG